MTDVEAAPTKAPAAEYRPLRSLVLREKNPRINDGDNPAVQKVVKSIIRFGFGNPILARLADGEVIAGHSRIKACLLLPALWKKASAKAKKSWHAEAIELATDKEPTVPVRFRDLPKSEATLLGLADNKIGELADWDNEALRVDLEQFSEEDREVAGWEEQELERIFAADADVDLDEIEVDELNEEEFWISVRGPLSAQPDALEKMREALLTIEGVEVEIGTTNDA